MTPFRWALPLIIAGTPIPRFGFPRKRLGPGRGGRRRRCRERTGPVELLRSLSAHENGSALALGACIALAYGPVLWLHDAPDASLSIVHYLFCWTCALAGAVGVALCLPRVVLLRRHLNRILAGVEGGDPFFDWRYRGQEVYLAGLTWKLTSWEPADAEEDHGCCEYCEVRIDARSDQVWGSENGDHWICRECHPYHERLMAAAKGQDA